MDTFCPKPLLVLYLLLGFIPGIYSQNVQLSELILSSEETGIQQYYELEVDLEGIRNTLQDAPLLGSGERGIQLQLPTADGQFRTFELWEAPIMMEGLASRFPMIRNFKGRDIDYPQRGVRLNIGTRGLFAVIHDEKDKSYIQTPGQYSDVHRLYYAKHTYNNWSCDVDETNLMPDGKVLDQPETNNCTELGDQLYTYRLVVATSGEFWNLNNMGAGLPDVLQALNDRLADMLIPYERDVAMTFQLVDSNDKVMYDNAATDPYTNPTSTSTSINQAEAAIEANFDDADYDIGQGYHEITCSGACGWAGLAWTPSACRNGVKSRAYTYQPNNIATNTVFSHEFGHQLGCLHCNYGCNSSGCHRVEPGQGKTIMSTSAGCSAADNYGARVDFFHARSIDAIKEYTLNGDFNNSNNSCNIFTFSGFPCVAQSATGNSIPTSDANPNALTLTIPINTPFFLEGAASDPDSDPWTANWVDYNSDPTNSSVPDNAGNSTTAPLFRWFEPNTEVIRYFPQLSSILNGNNTTGTGEVLPAVGRTMDFRFIVRDNATPYGALACDEITVTVDGGSGPFEITSQNAGAAWEWGEMINITWSVNNTDQAPISAANVDILLSTDGGQTFPTSLATSVPNDGSHTITVPNVLTSNARVKVQPSGSFIFFDINDGDIIISEGCIAEGESIFPSTLLQADEGDPALVLNMDFGSTFTSINDTLTTNDIVANIAVENNGMGTCIAFGNSPYHKIYPIKVSETGSYTFTKSGSIFPYLMTLYDPEFISNNVCNNWLASNGNSSGGVSISSTVSSSLTAISPYEFTFNGFNTGNTGTYTVTTSGPGDVYFPGNLIGGFDYNYVVVNDVSGDIELISATPDLTGLAPGNYTVHGINFDANENLSNYVGGPFSSLETAILVETICADLSSNTRPIEIQAALPLTFLSFEAEATKGGAQLDWSIVDPVNVSHFEVDRWGPDNAGFEPIARVDFKAGHMEYALLDPKIIPDEDYLYQIRSVDHDGSITRSAVRRVRTEEGAIFTVFPNPTSDLFNIKGPVQQIQKLEVVNASGQRVLDLPQTGNQISVQGWPDGVYELRLTTADQTHRVRLVVQ